MVARPWALTFLVFQGVTQSWDNRKPGRSFMTDSGEGSLAHDPQATAQCLDLSRARLRRHFDLS